MLGYGEAGAGQPLVLIHGFPFDHRMWVGQLTGLADGLRLIALDLPGRGRSIDIAPDGATIDSYADAVAGLIEELGIAPAAVCGLSMGGYVAFALWRRHPAAVGALVLAATRAGEDSEEGKAARNTNADLVWAESTIGLAEDMVPKLLSPASDGSVHRDVLEMFLDTPAMTAIADLAAMRDRPDSFPTLPTITVPVLIVRGADDQIATGDEATAMAAALPSAGEPVTIPDAGHLVPMEQPEAFNAAVRDFLGVAETNA